MECVMLQGTYSYDIGSAFSIPNNFVYATQVGRSKQYFNSNLN
jgi:hypothetical protein